MVKDKNFDINAEFNAVEAKFIEHCESKQDKNLWYAPRKRITGTLSIYVIEDHWGWTDYRECGEIQIQYLEEHKTTLAMKTTIPKSDDVKFFFWRTKTEKNKIEPSVEESNQAYERLLTSRFGFLQDICLAVTGEFKEMTLSTNNGLTKYAKNTITKRGRSFMEEKQFTNRMAVLHLIEFLREENRAITEKELIPIINEKIHLNEKLSYKTISNTKTKIKKLRTEDEDYLEAISRRAQEIASSWKKQW